MQLDINENIDIKEEDIAQFNNGKVLKELLTDHTRRQIVRAQEGHENDDAFIIWATDDYVEDNGYYVITSHLISEECVYNSDEYGIKLNFDKWNDCKILYQEIKDKN